MRGDKIVKFFMPKEERFHELLDRDTQHLLRAARLFGEIAASQSLDVRRTKVAELKALERATRSRRRSSTPSTRRSSRRSTGRTSASSPATSTTSSTTWREWRSS